MKFERRFQMFRVKEVVAVIRLPDQVTLSSLLRFFGQKFSPYFWIIFKRLYTNKTK